MKATLQTPDSAMDVNIAKRTDVLTYGGQTFVFLAKIDHVLVYREATAAEVTAADVWVDEPAPAATDPETAA